MSYISTLVSNMHAVRWQTPTQIDVLALIREVKQARASVGAGLLGICILPEDAEIPSDEIRKAMIDGMHSILDCCELVHSVFEGSGFKAAAMRAAMSAFFLHNPKPGSLVVFESVDVAVTAFRAKLKAPVDLVLQHLHSKNMLTIPHTGAAPYV